MADSERDIVLAAERLGGPDECIEYTALINIRPAQGNRSMFIANDVIRGRVRELTFALIGRGEPLP